MSALVVEIARMEAARHGIKNYILSEAIINTRNFELRDRVDIGYNNIAIVHDIVIVVNYDLVGPPIVITPKFPWILIDSEDKRLSIREWQTYPFVDIMNSIYLINYRNQLISVHRSFLQGTVNLTGGQTLHSVYAIATIINDLDYKEKEKN